MFSSKSRYRAGCICAWAGFMFDLLWPRALLIDFTHSFISRKNKNIMESHNSFSLLSFSFLPCISLFFCQSLYLSCVGLLMSFASCSFLSSFVFQWWNYFIFFSLLICLCMQLLSSNTNGLIWFVDVCKRGQRAILQHLT